MKPISLTKAAVFVALAASAQAALAADGNVNFVGKIVDTPCSISPNSTNLTVPLGTVSKSVLDGGAGKRSAPSSSRSTCSIAAPLPRAPRCRSRAPRPHPLDQIAHRRGRSDGLVRHRRGHRNRGLGRHAHQPGSNSAIYPLVAGNNSLQFQASYISVLAAVTTGTGNAVAQFTVTYQ